MAASTKKTAKKSSPSASKKSAKGPPVELNRFRANGKFVTSMLLDLKLHEWWSEECKTERRSFSALVNMLLERERARILKFREATAHLSEEDATPLSVHTNPLKAAKRKR